MLVAAFLVSAWYSFLWHVLMYVVLLYSGPEGPKYKDQSAIYN